MGAAARGDAPLCQLRIVGRKTEGDGICSRDLLAMVPCRLEFPVTRRTNGFADQVCAGPGRWIYGLRALHTPARVYCDKHAALHRFGRLAIPGLRHDLAHWFWGRHSRVVE